MKARRYVPLASTMRSGSTLLKALLASAPDIAHLPEVDFQKVLPSAARRGKIEALAEEEILLLKKPAWFHEVRSYPRIPDDPGIRRILLLRDVYETVRSVGRMIGGKRFDRFPGPWGHRILAKRYWAPVTGNLLKQARNHPDSAILVRYEDLLARPEEETLRLFRFIGSRQETGLRTYSTPESFRWKWGSDDGSPRIRTQMVQAPRPPRPEDLRRANALAAIPPIAKVRLAASYQ